MWRRAVGFGAIFTMMLVAPAVLSAEILKCTFPAKASNGGWIPEVVIFDYDNKEESVIVNDPLIAHFVGKPLRGKVAVDNKARLTVTWRIKATKDSASQFANMDYRLTYQKADKTASISGQALGGYEGPYSAYGRCGVAK